MLTFNIDNSDSQRYIDGNLSYSYNIFLRQRNEIINGTGEKTKEISILKKLITEVYKEHILRFAAQSIKSISVRP